MIKVLVLVMELSRSDVGEERIKRPLKREKELWASSYIGCSLNYRGDFSIALKSRRVRSFSGAWNPLLHAWHILFFFNFFF